MTTVIRAENLGKQYLIRHEQQGQRFAYDSLGENLAKRRQGIFQSAIASFLG